MQSIDITGVILAGGQGKRMGNQDKGLTLLANHPLIAHVISAFSPQVNSISISANQNISDYQKFGYEVFEDSISGFEGFAGPLAGLYGALLEANKEPKSSEALVVVPCDAPLLPKDLVSRLVKAAGASKPLAVIPHDGTRLQPLFGLYSLEVLPSLEAFLSSGQRKVGIWVESLSPQVVDFSDQPDAFLNINSPEDLAEAEKKI
ncbi:MAG: molybdenum cofactor guanylyltransferase MobA [Gammaproteobacteria bacterium]